MASGRCDGAVGIRSRVSRDNGALEQAVFDARGRAYERRRWCRCKWRGRDDSLDEHVHRHVAAEYERKWHLFDRIERPALRSVHIVEPRRRAPGRAGRGERYAASDCDRSSARMPRAALAATVCCRRCLFPAAVLSVADADAHVLRACTCACAELLYAPPAATANGVSNSTRSRTGCNRQHTEFDEAFGIANQPLLAFRALLPWRSRLAAATLSPIACVLLGQGIPCARAERTLLYM